MKSRPSVIHAALPGPDLGVIRVTKDAPGLANLLFPWARAVVASQRTGLPMLWPTWRQTGVGALVRRELPRFYGNLFTPSPRYIRGIGKQIDLRTLHQVPEFPMEKAPPYSTNHLYRFSLIGDLFSPILKDHELVRERLFEIVRAEHRPDGHSIPYIGVHVRLGDFSRPASDRDLDIRNGRVNFRMPIEWYTHAIRLIREVVGSAYPVKLFSDGTDAELAPVMALENVSRVPPTSALRDILNLSQAGVVIASGSTFSMWASYLGRMPVIWHAGQLRQRLYWDRPEIEIEIAGNGRLPPSFVDLLGCSTDSPIPNSTTETK